MAKGGSSGPLRGAYYPLHFATQTLSTPTTSAGFVLGTWAVPTGAEYVVTDIQAFSEFSGSLGASAFRGRVNVFSGSTSLLSSELSLASGSSASGTLTTTTGVVVGSGTVISATGSAGFGAGAAASNAQHVTVNVMGYIREHPSSIVGNFGSVL